MAEDGSTSDAVARAREVRKRVTRTLEEVRAAHEETGALSEARPAERAAKADGTGDGIPAAEGSADDGGLGGDVTALLARTRAVIAQTKRVIEETKTSLGDHHRDGGESEDGGTPPKDAAARDGKRKEGVKG